MLYTKGIKELSLLLNKKEVSSEEIVSSFIERIKIKDKVINSYITIDEQLLLQQAKESDRRRAQGKALSPFDGIPIAVKDNINTKGVRTTCASKILENFVPPFNATAYEKMLNSGMILLGKTNMDEFAMGSSTENSYFGPTKNPYNIER
ncbi:MAG TPA: amidase, partial [Spirochaetota bacterium]|nr:amidase [Spirochaetota bacterium]